MHARLLRFNVTSCVIAGLLVAGVSATGADTVEQLLNRIEVLEQRLAELEDKLPAGEEEEVVSTGDVTETALGFIGQTEISGAVSASYFYNANTPRSRENTGRGFDARADAFMANKFILRLEKPVEYGGLHWDVGYGAELIFGQDAEFTQASGLSLGDHGDLFEAFVAVNAPLGNGLKVLFGKSATPYGYELTQTEYNDHWSAGNQWTLLEPFTHTGLQLSYLVNERWEVALLVNNGWDVVADNNHAKSYMGAIYWTPNEKTSVTFLGYGGPEQDANTRDWRRGVSLALEHQCSAVFRTAIQLDYGKEDNAAVVGSVFDAGVGDFVPVFGGDAEWLGAGVWMVYEPAEKWNVALRGDWVKDTNGGRAGDGETPFLAPFAINTGQELWSLTLTVNLMPVEGLRIAPEIRWDRSSWDKAFDGHKDQVTIGLGAACLF